MKKKIRVGIFGLSRGHALGKNLMLAGAEIVAVCDWRESRHADARKSFGADVAVYKDFDSFLAHPMDAVLLANFFHEHAPYAVRCLSRGIHVLSECTAGGTLAECVELVRAAEKSGATYMLLENYPHMLFNREMKRICDGGTLGRILYAEGEYNHPVGPSDTGFTRTYHYFEEHWRHYTPRTYYITHSLAPLMYATGASPVRVTAFAVYHPLSADRPTASHQGDRAAIVTCLNDDGSVFRVTGCAAFGAHHNSYRVCGENGQFENLRGMGDKVMLRYNAWSKPEGMEENNLYTPSWNDPDEELIRSGGHGGGDYLVCREFLRCIDEGRRPDFDVYFATRMSAVAILAHRSVLAGGAPFDVPDFRREEDRVRYENDRETPFIGENGEKPTIPCCSKTDHIGNPEQLARYREVVAGLGKKV